MHSRWVVASLWLWAMWSSVATIEHLAGAAPSLAGAALGLAAAAIVAGRGRYLANDRQTAAPALRRPRPATRPAR